ncbi:MAG: hypothetical protein IT342_03140 [Candidatus Melainabacteria bacterium]|nr:hypothetical protein [Candidatus Melainabacteria bacterium]
MSIPKTLLITSTPPGDGSVGEIYLREVCRLLPQEKLVCFAAVSPAYFTGPLSSDLGELKVVMEKIPVETLIFRPIIQRLIGKPARALYEPVHTKKVQTLIARAIAFAARHQVEQVWAVLNSPTILKMARKVAFALKVPLVALIWDPPQAIARDRRLGSYSTSSMLREFGQVLKTARACACVSDPMADAYRSEFGANTLVLHRVFSKSKTLKPWAPKSDQIEIVFSGSNYAPKEFAALVNALTSVDWRINNKPVKLVMTGSNINLDVFAAGKPMHVEFLGFRSTEEMLQILANATCAYLPYPFSPEMALQAKLSFPDKLNTYIEVGCPVFYHGPKDSAAAAYMQKFAVGAGCYTHDENDILARLQSITSGGETVRRAQEEMERCRQMELNEDACRRQLAELLGGKLEKLESASGHASGHINGHG